MFKDEYIPNTGAFYKALESIDWIYPQESDILPDDGDIVLVETYDEPNRLFACEAVDERRFWRENRDNLRYKDFAEKNLEVAENHDKMSRSFWATSNDEPIFMLSEVKRWAWISKPE